MTKQGLRPSQRSIPRFLRHNAVWSEDLCRVRLSSLYPVAIVTPHGEWEQCSETLMSSFRPDDCSRAQGAGRLAEEDSTDARLSGLPGDCRGLPLLNRCLCKRASNGTKARAQSTARRIRILSRPAGALRFLRVSLSRFHAWCQRQQTFSLDDQSSCPHIGSRHR
jgi:hypothetical protein